MVKVFFSYATKDKYIFQVPRIAELLKVKHNIEDVFYWEESIPRSHIEFMDKSIKASDTCVFFYTENAANSAPVRKERDMAVYQGKHIIPVFVDINDVPEILQIETGVDTSDKSTEQLVEQIYLLISRKFGGFEELTKDSEDLTFISYAKENKDIAYSICESLENEGLQCWIAPRDILPSQSYPKAIISAIKTSKLMLIVLSNPANHSPHVMRELERALNNKIPILPFKIEDLELSEDMEYIIGSTHWLDASTAPLESHIPKLIKSIKSVLKTIK